MVSDLPIFETKLVDACSKITSDVIPNRVLYYDESNQIEAADLLKDIDKGQLLFYKRNRYKDQREFRFVYKANVPKQRGLEPPLGDLSDCVMKIDLVHQPVTFSLA
ncbi:hypothetical protein Q757_01110 [Oenococcus alcoholitolerans]|uniref:Uncharacterized protein n=1 Tax=Oenococcus alcoholitolerans TaxID=931074 RepID=A0ABR4XSF1_9LACO|nr:hypothetical protein Q757_01110 [Oenococcus alcoholitolerans]